jgi:lysozyme
MAQEAEVMTERLRKMLSLHEGRVPHAYTDSLGYLTIGVGHLIDKRKGGKLPEHIIDALLAHDIKEHADIMYRVNPWARQLDEVRQAVLIDMTFNLGPEPFDDDGFKDWPIFELQVKSGKYDAAADNMLSTKWALQVGARAQRLAKMMRTGTWPAELL